MLVVWHCCCWSTVPMTHIVFLLILVLPMSHVSYPVHARLTGSCRSCTLQNLETSQSDTEANAHHALSFRTPPIPLLSVIDRTCGAGQRLSLPAKNSLCECWARSKPERAGCHMPFKNCSSFQLQDDLQSKAATCCCCRSYYLPGGSVEQLPHDTPRSTTVL